MAEKLSLKSNRLMLDQKANLNSPEFTGTPKAPTASNLTNNTQIANTAFVNKAIATHQADLVSHGIYGVATGTNVLVMTDSKVTSYVDGMLVAFKNTTASTGATTLNINNLGAKAIVKANGTAVNNLKANAIYQLRYNGANFILLGEGGEYGTAVASDVLTGKTIGTDNGIVTGTMPNRGTFNLGLGVSVPAGYYSGGTTASGKRYLSGTVTSSTGTLPFQYAGATAENSVYYVTVTGLTFKPSTIIMIPSQTWGYIVVYSELNDGYYPKTVKTFNYDGSGSGSIILWNFKGDVASASVTSSGFVLPCVTNNLIYTWLAIE